MSTSLTKPQLMEQNVELQKKIADLQKAISEIQVNEKVQSQGKDANAQALELLAGNLVESDHEREVRYAKEHNSYLCPPPKPINDMIELEWDEWRLEELEARLKQAREGGPIHSEYKRLIKDHHVKIVDDYQATMGIDPSVVTPFSDMFKQSQQVAAKILKKRKKAQKADKKGTW